MEWYLWLIIVLLFVIIVYGAYKRNAIFNLILWVMCFPIFVLISPYIYYRFMRGFHDRLSYFLTFGREMIGGYRGKLKIGTNKNNVIYETDNWDIWGRIGAWTDNEKRNVTTLLKMRVYNYWLEEDYLFIKVFSNDKLINKMKDEIKAVNGNGGDVS